jgi:hypothetical protein
MSERSVRPVSRFVVGWTSFLGLASWGVMGALHLQGIFSDSKAMAIGGECLLVATGVVSFMAFSVAFAHLALIGLRLNVGRILLVWAVLLNAAGVAMVIVLMNRA